MRICILILVAASVAAFSVLILPASALHQEPRNSSNTGRRRPVPTFELHADGGPIMPSQEVTDSEQTILNSPMPSIWLAYPENYRARSVNSDLRVQLQPGTLSKLDKYWKHSLAFSLTELKPSQESSAKVSRDVERLALFEESRRFLLYSDIETQNGVRKISENEADSLLKYIGLAAYDFVKNSNASRDVSRTQNRLN